MSVGRGGTRGKTSGRGTKGQNARAGHKNRPEFRDIIKKLPKLRGRGRNINTSRRTKPAVVSLATLEKHFKGGEAITPVLLMQERVIRPESGKTPKVKIVAGGTLTKKFSFSGCLFSESAKAEVLAGGSTIA